VPPLRLLVAGISYQRHAFHPRSSHVVVVDKVALGQVLSVPVHYCQYQSTPVSTITLLSLPFHSVSTIALLSVPFHSCHYNSTPVSTIALLSLPFHSCQYQTTPVTTIPLLSLQFHSCQYHSTPVTTIPLLSPPFHSCIPIFFYMLLLARGQIGEASKPSKQQCSRGIRGGMHRKFFQLFHTSVALLRYVTLETKVRHRATKWDKHTFYSEYFSSALLLWTIMFLRLGRMRDTWQSLRECLFQSRNDWIAKYFNFSSYALKCWSYCTSPRISQQQGFASTVINFSFIFNAVILCIAERFSGKLCKNYNYETCKKKWTGHWKGYAARSMWLAALIHGTYLAGIGTAVLRPALSSEHQDSCISHLTVTRKNESRNEN
jgi:hypothetical protein